ncbi:MAG: peptidoglycan DD-metalloendopeptidase family protein [Chrysiogenetes bacterium]|nr:peptidoglycan DD-metalloendopeptidase family protein [Chrysiogenetes bacterium]
MRALRRGICCAALALVLVPLVAHAQGNPSGVNDLQEQASERRKELTELRNLLAGEQERLEQVAKKEKSVLDLLEGTERELARLQRAERKLSARIKKLKKDIAANKRAIEVKKEELELERAALAKRLVGLYKLGPTGSLRVLLSSASISDLQRQRHSLGLILEQDAERVEQYKALLADLSRLETELDEQRIELEDKQQALKKNRDAALVERDNRLKIVRSVQREKANYEQVVSELDEQSRRLELLLETISKRIRSQALLQNKAGSLQFADYRGSLIPPVPGKVLARFGKNINERFGTVTFNNGVEFAAKPGADIEAVFGGVVIFADRFKGYGNLLIIDHGDNFYTLYAHCRDLKKQVGDPVEAREIVATVGDSGSLKGPSCYFEIREKGQALDPSGWLLME